MKIQRRKAPIFAIDRLRFGTDGKGITTLVCFMGCPFRCAYCLNVQCHDEDFELDGNTPRKEVMLLTPQELYDHVNIVMLSWKTCSVSSTKRELMTLNYRESLVPV